MNDKAKGAEWMQTMVRPLIEMHVAGVGRPGGVKDAIDGLAALVTRAFNAGYDVGRRDERKGGGA